MRHKMEELTQMYTFICERCGEIKQIPDLKTQAQDIFEMLKVDHK